MMSSSRSLNHPSLPRSSPLVWQGPGGMRNHEKTPTMKVTMASRRNSHRQPPQPRMPRICSIPAASRDPTMLQVLRAVQKKASLTGSSFDL